ncbi:Myosin heavy chain, muscle, partial [Zootermopsis nevadensis]
MPKPVQQEGDDPDPTPYLFVSLEQKRMDQTKPYDAKKACWVPDEKEGYVLGEIKATKGDLVTVSLPGGEDKNVKKDLICQVNPPKFEKVEDMADLTYLNEASVLHNLRQRYYCKLIYDKNFKKEQVTQVNPPKYEKCEDMSNLTYLNDASVLHNLKQRYYHKLIYVILLNDIFPALNPGNKPVPGYTAPVFLYSCIYLVCDELHSLHGPNVITVHSVSHFRVKMTLIGESGAGKTENTKKVIAYFATVGASQSKKEEAAKEKKGSLEDQVVQTNPVLEAFGNAKTVRNDNSSRFGKFIRIHFGPAGKLAGADIETYLLEKARVISQQSLERSYHIFYQIMSGSVPGVKDMCSLSNDIYEYHYVSQGKTTIPNVDDGEELQLTDVNKCMLSENIYDYYNVSQGKITIPNVDDGEELQLTDQAFDVLGFTQEEKDNVYKITASVMHMGGMKFKQRGREEQAEADGTEEGARVAKLLGTEVEELYKNFLKPRIKVGNEFVTQGRNKDQVAYSVGAMSKGMFDRVFKWLVKKCNETLDTKQKRQHFIGVLDIAGFEIFDYNGFEQLCINFTNEKLQQFFNHHMFVLEQEEYKKEGINWDFIDFGMDLLACIDLIEKFNGFEQLCINFTNEKLQQFFNHHMFVLEQEEYKKEGIEWAFIDFGMDLLACIELIEKFNGFEQLCINFTNEKLQQFFNHHMFVLEQEEYKREGIDWTFIDFGMDLQACIELIEKPMGIMSILEEESMFPKATDRTFEEKLMNNHLGKSPNFQKPKPPKPGQAAAHFAIGHYAGTVSYNITGWLEKNKDPLNDTVVDQFKKASNKLLVEIFADHPGQSGAVVDSSGGGGKGGRGKKGGGFATVSSSYKEQLNNLMTTLRSTQPHFVRCIIPNELKQPGLIDSHLVMHQLTCNGVLEGIRICRKGFPNRMVYPDFKLRYKILCAHLIKEPTDAQKATQIILDHINIDSEQYRMGHTKVFFRAGVLGQLEELRDERLSKIITWLQSWIRAYLSRKEYKKLQDQRRIALQVVQRNLRKYLQLRTWPWWKLWQKVKPMLNVTRIEDEI